MMKINRLLSVIVLTGIIFGQYNSDNHVVTTSMYYLKYNPDGSWAELDELMEEEFTKMNHIHGKRVLLGKKTEAIAEYLGEGKWKKEEQTSYASEYPHPFKKHPGGRGEGKGEERKRERR